MWSGSRVPVLVWISVTLHSLVDHLITQEHCQDNGVTIATAPEVGHFHALCKVKIKNLLRSFTKNVTYKAVFWLILICLLISLIISYVELVSIIGENSSSKKIQWNNHLTNWFAGNNLVDLFFLLIRWFN